jgi:DNA repair exonuclease SbcCD ATPase subunit
MSKITIKNSIAHLSDIHIRYGSRHQEYKEVFEETIKDLKKQKPRRIALTGDLFHIKITLSPKAVQLAGWFLKELSKIAPVDLILGNHDLNLQSLDQGNAIEPIIDLVNGGYIVEKGEKELPVHVGEGNGIFFFLHSGFYNVEDDIVYGIYSCLDDEILTLSNKDKDKTYIAMYHGPVYGSRGNNGYELHSNEYMMKLSSFNNFDIVMLGDIHEHQAFSLKGSSVENVAYPGSLIQQDYGESIDKGYIIWNLETKKFERKFIPNNYGFSSLHISKGELFEERLEDLKLSNNPKKTKVSIVWEEYEENYSVEKEKQIEKFIKNKYGCEIINIDCKYISKEDEIDELSIDDDIDYSNTDEFEDLLKEFVENSEYDNEEEVLELSRKIDEELNYLITKGKKWFLDSLEVWNLFGFPSEKTTFDFNKMTSVTGIFGKNFSGKTNIIRALVWIAYRKILGGGEPYRLTNMYTKDDKAGGRIYLTIDSQKYYIERTVKVKTKKDGTYDVSYGVEYKVLKTDEEGKEKWVSIDSEKAATEKKERNNIIIDSIGTFDDFTKIVLQAQGGEGNFLDMSQQPKNDLINKYLGLEIFRDRYEFAKKTFNDIKAKQKFLGSSKEHQESIEKEKESIKSNKTSLKQYQDEKLDVEKLVEKQEIKILELTKTLIKVEETKYKDVESANKITEKTKVNIDNNNNAQKELSDWLSINFKKELPQDNVLTVSEIERKLKEERSFFETEKKEYNSIMSWIEENPKQKEIDVKPLNSKILEIESALSKLRDKLEISKGKKCPTCGNVEQKADLELEKKCTSDIERGEISLKNKNIELKNAEDIVSHNITFDKKQNKLGSIKNSLKERKIKIDNLKESLETSMKIDDIKKHNNLVESKSKELENLKNENLSLNKELESVEKDISILETNKNSIESNKDINLKIKLYEDEKKSLKLIINQLNDKLTSIKSEIRISENNIENLEEKLEVIKKAESSFSKYAIYLQAVHRDGIPARIIKKKLPVINYKINSILKNLVDFKVELTIKSNGDIKEFFYFNSLERDGLPMSMASGAQKFIGSVAIRDSLHFVSSLTKPSLCIIDEGFGSLDDDLTIAMQSVFYYLKDKYKNIWIITHKNEIKDFVDNIIQVSKDRRMLTDEQMKDNPKAGISVFDLSHSNNKGEVNKVKELVH